MAKGKEAIAKIPPNDDGEGMKAVFYAEMPSLEKYLVVVPKVVLPKEGGAKKWFERFRLRLTTVYRIPQKEIHLLGDKEEGNRVMFYIALPIGAGDTLKKIEHLQEKERPVVYVNAGKFTLIPSGKVMEPCWNEPDFIDLEEETEVAAVTDAGTGSMED